jgi:hypothetical protein
LSRGKEKEEEEEESKDEKMELRMIPIAFKG